MERERLVVCGRCGGDIAVDEDGRQSSKESTSNPCVCQEFELPPTGGGEATVCQGFRVSGRAGA